MTVTPQVVSAVTACGAQMLCGMSSGFTSPALPELRAELQLSVSQESLITALMPLGSALGSPLAALVLDRVGRKAVFVALAVYYFTGWLLVTYAGSAETLMAGRAVQGVGCGGSFIVLPNYIGEVAEPHVRGTLSIFMQLGFCCGTLLEFVVGKYVSWRWLALLSAAVAAVWLPCLAVITESPLWLVMRRRPRAALDALQRLRAPQHDCKAELAELEHFARDVLRRRVRPREALRPPYIGPILIVAGLFFFQPASGNDALTYFTVDILDAADSALEPHTASILASAMWIPATLVAALLADRAGRRPLLMVSSGLTAACTAALGAFFYLRDAGHDVSGYSWLPLAALITFNPAFAVGLGMVPWIIIGEMFAPEMRGWGASVGTTLTSLVTTLITVSFTGLAGAITQAGVFWLYSAITVLGVFFTLFCVLETKGKTLEEITEHFKGPDRRRPSGPVATEKEAEVDRPSGQPARHRHSLSLDNGAPSGDTLCDKL
ncbi:facilitated trehalose transporter Tret1-like [Amphibalanus amphitrite]|uniref:facilitated trehalose transporter Tret1-like n=1 Tax=Amphibalanus amphitrite TaxID=1232801 RepID=UPI001C914DF1|nr:facilitated trehalose transporter Tret1-like [Amphibalanus amphitrite]